MFCYVQCVSEMSLKLEITIKIEEKRILYFEIALDWNSQV